MDPLVQKVLHTIEKNHLINNNDTVFVAVSGGADSVTLLHILHSLQQQLGLQELIALHVHHGLRGAEADEDFAFVQELCNRLQVPLIWSRFDVVDEAKKAHESIEEAGRRLRYLFFEDASKSKANAKIATAHSADDCAETIVLNMIRGCSTHGLSGTPIKRGNIIRPLFDCSAAEIRAFCQQYNYVYKTDSTNTDVSYARNRVRHSIIPQMQKINERATQNILRMSRIAREEDMFLHAMAKTVLSQAKRSDYAYDINTFQNAPTVIRRRALQLVIQQVVTGHSSEYQHITAMEQLITNQLLCVNLPDNTRAVIENECLVFYRNHSIEAKTIESVSIIPNETVFFDLIPYRISIISQQEFKNTIKIHKNLFNFCISYDMIESSLVLRTRQVGDTIRPYKRNCKKTIKKLMNELKIPASQRDVLPLLCDANGVLAILGMAVDERVAVHETTQQILWIQPISTIDGEKKS